MKIIKKKNFQAIFIFLLFIISISVNLQAQQNQPDERDLMIGQKIERKVVNQEIHLYGIQLRRGQVLKVAFQEKGADVGAVFARISDQKKVSAALNAGGGFGRENLTLIANQDGMYALIVRAQQITDSKKDALYEVFATLDNFATANDTLKMRGELLFEESYQIYLSNDTENFPSAVAKLEEITKIAKTLTDTYWENMSKFSIGNIYLKAQNFSKAEPYFLQTLTYFELISAKQEAGAALTALGIIYTVNKNETKASAYLSRALQISRELGDKRTEEILNTLNLGNLNNFNGNNNSTDYTKELAEAKVKNDKPTQAAIWAKILYRYIDDEEMDEDERLAVFKRAESEALPLFKEITDRDSEMKVLVFLGMGLYDAVDEAENEDEPKIVVKARAISYLRQSLLLAKAHNNKIIETFTFMGLNLIYDGENDKLAIFYEKKAVNNMHIIRQTLKGIDKETQQDFAKQFAAGYETLAADLYFEQRLEEAHQTINFSRDQEFFDFQLTPNQTPNKLTLTDREIENEQIFDQAIEKILVKYTALPNADYQLAADEAASTFHLLEQNFSVPKSEKDIAKNVPDTIDMQAALRELSVKTGKKYAAIYVSDDSSQIILITSENIKGFGMSDLLKESGNYSAGLYNEILKDVKAGKIPKEEAIKRGKEAELKSKQRTEELIAEQSEERVFEFLEDLRSPTTDPRPRGAIIYRKIFKKTDINKQSNQTLEAELEKYQPDVLLWSLGGKLRYIPIAALYDEEKKQYVAEKYENAVFTRARKARFLTEPKPWTSGLGFGTTIAFQGFSPLPKVKEELTSIFGDQTTNQKGYFSGRIFLDPKFTKQSFLMNAKTKPAFIHIASHFSFQPGNAKNSFLLLGDGTKLSLIDIQQNFQMFEGVDLITLSACETAAQQPNAEGKEIDGFAELAQRLGASSVLATLWKVSDEGTSKLMIEFYRLKQQNPDISKSAALRRAQLNLLYGKNINADGTKRTVRGIEPVGTTGGSNKIPFKPSPDSPFEHPFYWASFVLYGSTR